MVSFLTTQTKHARHAEPLLVFSSAYMAFVVAEIFHWCVFASTIIVDFSVDGRRRTGEVPPVIVSCKSAPS